MATFDKFLEDVGKMPIIRKTGLLEDYQPEGAHKDVIYFAEDVQYIYLNGKPYGKDDITELQQAIKKIQQDLYGSSDSDLGNAVLVNKTTLEKVSVPVEELENFSPDEWEPIGVVVIPSNHDVYGTGECGVMALMSASLSTPDEGQPTDVKMACGAPDTDYPELTHFNACSSCGDKDNGWTPVQLIPIQMTSLGFPYYAYLPSDQESWRDKLLNPNGEQSSWYYDKYFSPYAPSPYNEDGSRNSGYYINGGATNNVLSDFAGKLNTPVLCSKVTSQPDWKTEPIIDSSDAGYHPAACTCWRFHTIGTKQGDWYLPACGEFGYCCVRFNKINGTIAVLQSYFGKAFCPLNPYNSYGVSSLPDYDSNYGCLVGLSSGMVNIASIEAYGKGAVRPFTRFKLSQSSKFYTKEESNEKFVEKVEGKQLSTEDFTTPLKTKLEGLINYEDSIPTITLELYQNPNNPSNYFMNDIVDGNPGAEQVKKLIKDKITTFRLKSSNGVLPDDGILFRENQAITTENISGYHKDMYDNFLLLKAEPRDVYDNVATVHFWEFSLNIIPVEEANKATKLGSENVGSELVPMYLDKGTPKALPNPAVHIQGVCAEGYLYLGHLGQNNPLSPGSMHIVGNTSCSTTVLSKSTRDIDIDISDSTNLLDVVIDFRKNSPIISGFIKTQGYQGWDIVVVNIATEENPYWEVYLHFTAASNMYNLQVFTSENAEVKWNGKLSTSTTLNIVTRLSESNMVSRFDKEGKLINGVLEETEDIPTITLDMNMLGDYQEPFYHIDQWAAKGDFVYYEQYPGDLYDQLLNLPRTFKLFLRGPHHEFHESSYIFHDGWCIDMVHEATPYSIRIRKLEVTRETFAGDTYAVLTIYTRYVGDTGMFLSLNSSFITQTLPKIIPSELNTIPSLINKLKENWDSSPTERTLVGYRGKIGNTIYDGPDFKYEVADILNHIYNPSCLRVLKIKLIPWGTGPGLDSPHLVDYIFKSSYKSNNRTFDVFEGNTSYTLQNIVYTIHSELQIQEPSFDDSYCYFQITYTLTNISPLGPEGWYDYGGEN